MDHSKVEAKLADLAAFINDAEDAAYSRGFQDAIAKVTAVAYQMEATGAYQLKGNTAELIVTRAQKDENKQEPRSGSDQAKVLKDIREHPGSRGFEIVKRFDGQIQERTIRTAIHRLKLRKAILKQEDKWFPAAITSESSRGGQTPEASGNPSGGMAERINAADSKSVGGL